VGLDKQVVGRVVYASDDDDATAAERDLESFDEALAAPTAEDLPPAEAPSREAVTAGTEGSASDGRLALPPADALQDYLNDPDRLAFRDELELAALEDEMRREAAGAR
jgi:hypothetical protein